MIPSSTPSTPTASWPHWNRWPTCCAISPGKNPCCNSRAASRKPAKTIAPSFARPPMPPIAPICPFTPWIRAACWRKFRAAMPASERSPSGNLTMYTGAARLQQSGARQDSRETLATLASDTGGRSFFDLGDLGQAFHSVQSDTAGYYLLGYYSANTQHDGRWRTIRVKARRSTRRPYSLSSGLLRAKGFRRLHDGRSRAPIGRSHAFRQPCRGIARCGGDRLFPPRQ